MRRNNFESDDGNKALPSAGSEGNHSAPALNADLHIEHAIKADLVIDSFVLRIFALEAVEVQQLS